MASNAIGLLHQEIRACTTCAHHLPFPPRPIFQFSAKSRILICGQAPGRVVHEGGVPFDDKSGERLREWLGVDRVQFYNDELFAIVPMGFCFPGKEGSADAPPRAECAPQWHARVFAAMPEVRLTVLIGQYAIGHYLHRTEARNLTETVRHFAEYLPDHFPVVHPSPLNFRWQSRNPWFEAEVVPALKQHVERAMR